MYRPDFGYKYVWRHHQGLIRVASNARLIRSSMGNPPSFWDELLVHSGDLLISMGNKLKERSLSAQKSMEPPVEPCVECP